MNASRTIVAIRLRQLGDVLATLGTLRALKEHGPDFRLVFIADARYHALLSRASFIDQLVAEPPPVSFPAGALKYGGYVRGLRAMRPAAVLDFHSNTRSAILTGLIGARVRIGFDVRLRKVAYTSVEPRAYFDDERRLPRNSHESAMDLARRFCSLGEGSPCRTLPVSDEERARGMELLETAGLPAGAIESRRVVGLNPGNPYPAKAWPASSFIALARRVVESGRPVIVLWGPGEDERARRIAADAGQGVSVAPALSLEQMPACLTSLACVVTIDSGLKHLAVAIGVPTVTLFGPTSPEEWHMGGAADRYLWQRPPCSPCRLFECPMDSHCMEQLTPDAVVAEVEKVVVEGAAA